MKISVSVAFSLFLAVALCGCGSGESQADATDTVRHEFPDTLRVATIYSPKSYFIYRDEPMGFDYALLSGLAADKKVHLDLQIASSISNALSMLDSGYVDVVAYEIPVTGEYNRRVVHCGPESLSHQVLVQPKSGTTVTDVTELVGKDIYVADKSKYYYRIMNLNDELGGGINVHALKADSILAEDLLEKVAQGELPMTVVDSDIARLNRTYYPDLDITLALSFDQKAQWAVRPDHKWLADSINAYFGNERPRRQINVEYRRYFELSKALPTVLTYDLSSGRISPYDDLFRKQAKNLGWDWRLLASQGFVESRFDSSVVSWAGARGIMQIMPGTARANGVAPEALVNPGTSVEVAVKVLAATDRIMQRYVPDPVQRQKFVLAAYNSGAAHIIDAIALAGKYGLKADVWDSNVEEALLMKSNPQYYNDPVVKYGYFRGRQTVEYVKQVSAFYERCKKNIKA